MIDEVPAWKFTNLTLSFELPDLIKLKLLSASTSEMESFFAGVNLSSPTLKQMISDLVSASVNQLSKTNQLSTSDKVQVQLLSALLKTPNTLKVIQGSLVSLSNLHYLRVLSEGSKRTVYPRDLTTRIATF